MSPVKKQGLEQYLPLVEAMMDLSDEQIDPHSLVFQEESKVLKVPYSQLIDRDSFEDINHLGSGSFSDVFSAFTKDKTVIALKDYNLGIGGGDAKRYVNRRNAFLREVRMYQVLGEHKQIPTFLGVAVKKTKYGKFAEFQPTIAMEYVSGKSLQQMIEDKDQISSNSIRDILEQSISPLKEIHHGAKNPRFHRDIKPSNLKLNDEGLLYFLDFGTMRDEIIETMNGTMAVGSAPYVHKQQLIDGKPTFRTELYSLGRTLYALSLGRELKAGELFSREKMDSTNVDNETKDIIEILCDEDLGGVKDVRELESLIEGKPVKAIAITNDSLETKDNLLYLNDNKLNKLVVSENPIYNMSAMIGVALAGVVGYDLLNLPYSTDLGTDMLLGISAASIITFGYALKKVIPEFKIRTQLAKLPKSIQFGEDFDYKIAKKTLNDIYNTNKKGNSFVRKFPINNHYFLGEIVETDSSKPHGLFLSINSDQSISFHGKNHNMTVRTGSSVSVGGGDIVTKRMYTKKEFKYNSDNNKIFRKTMKRLKKRDTCFYETLYAMLPEENPITQDEPRQNFGIDHIRREEKKKKQDREVIINHDFFISAPEKNLNPDKQSIPPPKPMRKSYE